MRWRSNPVIYAELSVSFLTIEALDGVIATMELAVQEIPKPALFPAGKAFAQYGHRGGGKARVLPDFSLARMPRFEGGLC
jgi:hypothetical protein